MFKHHFLLIITYILATIGANHLSAQATSVAFVNINNVNAGFSSCGNLFDSGVSSFRGDTSGFLYEVPKGSSIREIYTSALWMGAFDIANNLHLAAQMEFSASYNYAPRNDYYPGPVDNSNSSQLQYCKQVFVISRAAVNHFLGLSFPASWNEVDTSILDWPAFGNTYLDTFKSVKITSDLAPFIDVDNDGIYNPLKGDYPDFCGDQAVFFVYNDSAGPHHASFGSSLGFEVKALAYEFVNADTDGIYNNAKTAVNNTVFLHLLINNKSGRDYTGFRLGLFEDPDIACNENERCGCDTNRNLMFAYSGSTQNPNCGNEFGYQSYQTAHGVAILNEKLETFIYFTNGAVAAQAEPVQDTSPGVYYNYLNGFWADSTPITYGGTGYGGNEPFNFCFPGSLTDTAQWSELTVRGFAAGDRRFVGSIPASDFKAGQIKYLDLAFITSYDSTATFISIVDTLKRDVDIVQSFYNSNIAACLNQLPSVIKNISNGESMELQISPNPANYQISIHAADTIQSLDLMDFRGIITMHLETVPNNYTLNVSQLAKGVYLLKAVSGNSSATKKIVIE